MIFRETWEQVIDRTKTRTRRLVKVDYDHVLFPDSTEIEKVVKIKRHPCLVHRTIYEVGKTYGVQPGRGKKSVGRFKIEKIRREFLHDITGKECFLEGIGLPDWIDKGVTDAHVLTAALFNWDIWNRIMLYGMDQFIKLWDSIYAGSSYEFETNPEVWVLEIECVDPFGWASDTSSTHYFKRLPEPIFWSKKKSGEEGHLHYMSRCGNSFATELERVDMPPGRGYQSCNSLIKYDRNKIRMKLAGEKNE